MCINGKMEMIGPFAVQEWMNLRHLPFSIDETPLMPEQNHWWGIFNPPRISNSMCSVRQINACAFGIR